MPGLDRGFSVKSANGQSFWRTQLGDENVGLQNFFNLRETNQCIRNTTDSIAELLFLSRDFDVLINEFKLDPRFDRVNIGLSLREDGDFVTALAKQSGTSRARITAVLRGDSEGISLEVLLRILGALGQTVKVSFGKSA